MSQKELAFELFSQGHDINSPEVQQLTLQKSTLERYFAAWRARQGEETPTETPVIPGPATPAALAALQQAEEPAEAAPPTDTPVGGLADGTIFIHEGQQYQKLRSATTGRGQRVSVCLRISPRQGANLPHDTLVHI